MAVYGIETAGFTIFRYAAAAATAQSDSPAVAAPHESVEPSSSAVAGPDESVEPSSSAVAAAPQHAPLAVPGTPGSPSMNRTPAR